MTTPERFLEMYEYDSWANRRVLARLREVPTVPDKSVARMTHILLGDRMWLRRMGHLEEDPGDIFRSEPLEALGPLEESTAAELRAFIGGLGDGGAEREFEYISWEGEPLDARYGDVLTHLITHSMYHRGQVAVDLRAVDEEAPYTDFMLYVQQQRGRQLQY